MAKIQYASDLHLDTRGDELNHQIFQGMALGSKEADTLLLVGDIARANHDGWDNWLSFMCNHWHQVLIVPGNHEYWGLTWAKANGWFKHWQKEYPQVKFLDNELWEMPNGLLLAGSTLWYKDHPLTRAQAPQYNDFKAIGDAYEWLFERGTQSRKWLESLIDPKIAIIATHVPTDTRLIEHNLGLSCFFAHQLDLWAAPTMISGHTHKPFDVILQTPWSLNCFLSNPLGYDHEPQFSTFQNQFIEL